MKGTIWVMAAGLALTITGCKKFLEKEPNNRAKLDSPEKVSQLLGTAYPRGNYQLLAELASDNAADLVTASSGVPDWERLASDVYFYRDFRGSGENEDNQDGYWFSCYKAIGAANQALEAIEQAPNKDAYRAQKGEALVARAYAHFMLVNFFSKFYDPATAATDAGVPYVVRPETVSVDQYDRGTVKEVYEKVEKDLLEGIPLIDENSYRIPKYHFTKTAAYAFASRYYLYKKDYQKVIQYANLSIAETAIKNSLRPWNTYYSTLDLNGNLTLGKVYSGATEKSNLLLVETQSWWLYIMGTARYGPNQQTVRSATGNEPLTGKPWAFSAAQYITGHLFIPKIELHFVETSIGSGIGNGWQMIPLFTAEEVLFNLAEAYAYTGQAAKGITLLNDYISTRVQSYSSATDLLTADKILNATGASNIQDGLVILLLYYRRVEFLHEGLRWFDILRYKIPVVHSQIDGTGTVVGTVSLAPDDPRRVFQVPPTVAESGITPNPR